jgi:hypothetical protein
MPKQATGQRKAATGEQPRLLDLKKVETRGKRFLSVAPQTYDATERTVEIILSEGSAVDRWYGTEVLSTEQAAVCINRLASSGIPFLDSHNTYGMDAVLGRIIDIWFAEGRIMGRAQFAETDAGKTAEGMVARREMSGVSIGYRVDAWTITDTDGTVIDPDKSILNLDDKLTFTATRWELLEVSLVSVPADPAAMIRSSDVATDQDLRTSPMGKGAKEITITRGDTSVTYRYGADAPQERAWPDTRKGTPTMPKTKADAARGSRAVRAKRGDETKPTVDKDGYWVNADGDYCDADGKKSDEPMKSDRAAPTVDKDGYWVNEDGDYSDDLGNKVDEPILADAGVGRAAPEVDDDGYYVDEDGNYVDADGEPSDDPVLAERDMDGDGDNDEGDRKQRGKRSAVATRSTSSQGGLSRKDTAELVRIGDQARGLKIELDVAGAIARDLKPAALRKIMFDKLAARSAESKIRGGNDVAQIRVIRDERQGRAGAMELALVTQLLGSRGSDGIEYKPKNRADKKFVEANSARSEQYMGMGFVEIAAECIGHRGNIRTPSHALGIIERAFQSTSDFPAIFQNVLNKSLLARYELMTPTYQSIAIERPFNDFRPHPMVRAGDFPSLQPITETGELKAGASLDSGENVSVKPYGVIFPISRQMIVNDQLGAIDQILGSAGDTVRIFENTTFYAMFNSNPALLQDGQQVFSAAHNNLAATAGVISVLNVGNGRAALREMRSLSKLLLNVPPRIILTGPQQETFADQLVATISPLQLSAVNPFSGKLQSVSDANITDDSWYLMADPARVPCFVYGFLNGSTGPRVRTFEPFGIQGVQVSLEHDFGCGAIDYRGGYRNPGALPTS